MHIGLASAYEHEAWRYCSPEYDPLKGTGAYRKGGRFNPPGIFTLYLCSTKACAEPEYRKELAKREREAKEAGYPKLMPVQILYNYRARLHSVLDLTSHQTLEAIGVSRRDLTTSNWRICQDIGQEAYGERFQAVLSWSATGRDKIIAVFTDHTKTG